MNRLLVFVLTITLTFCFTACAMIEDASPGESHESGKSNTETIEETKEPEKTDYTETAQQAYDLVEDAESLCKSGMSIISVAWHFGIWDAPECAADIVTERLSAQIGFEFSTQTLKTDFQRCRRKSVFACRGSTPAPLNSP